MKLKFTLEKETSGTYRYKEDSPKEDPKIVIGTLYVRKDSIKGGVAPKKLTVTIAEI